MENSAFQFEFIQSISKVNAADWDRLAGDLPPFISYAFLSALESSRSVGFETGWQPQHLLIYQNERLVGMLPLYSKTHSYGEYVFDFAWANAYHQHGLAYYPKLVSAIPFTPVTSERLILDERLSSEELIPDILQELRLFVEEKGYSSLHCLFLPMEMSKTLETNKLVQRRSVQFQWFNREYSDFNAFLLSLTARRRKSIRKERQKVGNANVQVSRICGDQMNAEHMDFFYQCYRQTYLKRSGHEGYLTKAFFDQILQNMAANLMLVIAQIGQEPVAAALYIYNKNQLCGRYWGALRDVDGLHFECCYYQGIEFCIEKNIASFNPGTQGEHKILRGFEPIYCYSNHWLKEPAFHHAITKFVEQESPEITRYKEQAAELLPFKQLD